jgi:hypothetical protein
LAELLRQDSRRNVNARIVQDAVERGRAAPQSVCSDERTIRRPFYRTVAVLNVRRMHGHANRQANGIGQDMPLRPLTIFSAA